MKQMTVRATIMLVISAAFICGIVIFCLIYIVDAQSWALYPANGHVFSDGEISRAGAITDRNGTVLAHTVNGKRVYNEDSDIRKATLHVVGDLNGYISTGLHNRYLAQLVGYNIVGGVYQYKNQGNNIQTTLDSELCVTALDALDGRKGTVGVYNYKTGETLCMVSSPTYDINDEDECEKAKSGEYKGVFINRFISSTYTPGSTFKLITAAASLDTFSDAFTREYTCKGGVSKSGEWISCMGNHGTLTLKKALAKSCNSYFSQLAVDLGADTMDKYANKMGFNKSFSIDGIAAATSYFNVEGTREIDLAWAGMGQHTNMMNPLQYITMLGAIANEGVPVQPYLIKSIRSQSGIQTKSGSATNGSRMLSAATANSLAELMASNVQLNYGTGNFPGLELCAKSGTAEVGKDKTPHAIFVGFTRNEELPLAFVVVVENGGSGSTVAGRIANRVLQAAKSDN